MMVSPRTLALAASLLALPASALAQVPATAAPPEAAAPAQADPVLARVHGVEIRQSDLDIAEDDIGQQAVQNMNFEQKRDYLLGFLIDLTIAARAGEERNLQGGTDFARKLAYQRRKLLVEALLNAETASRVTEAEMRKVYDEQIGRVPPTEEVRARHILVEQEAEARAIIAQLRGGADFAVVAREKSKDTGSGTEGGDLGFFTREQMVREFADAAFTLTPGTISTDPVRSQFGWHVIRVEEKRNRPAPTFEQVRPQIEEFLTRRVQGELVQRLRASAQVERLIPQAAPAPSATPATPTPR